MDPRELADPDDVSCGVCREPVRDDQARLLASREDLAVLEIHCSACESVTLGFVFTSGDSRPAGSPGGPQRDLPPITADDVLDMHLHLEGWQGDLHSLLAGAPRQDPGQ